VGYVENISSIQVDIGALGVIIRNRRGEKMNEKSPQERYLERSFMTPMEQALWGTTIALSLPHARTEIENWRREYNEERPKKALGGLTPAAYAKQLH
jgi:transposase InsO family protein